MEIAILILLILVLLVQAVVLYQQNTARKKSSDAAPWDKSLQQSEERQQKQLTTLKEDLHLTLQTLSATGQTSTAQQLSLMERRLHSLESSNEDKLDKIRQTVAQSLNQQRVENNQRLEDIRGTVDERLQSTLETRISESFQSVSKQLEEVYKGLGEMKNLANDVGGLKQVLSGVKTRGILGEVQLEAILQEILAPEQYETNVATVPGSSNRVEFAIRLPGQSEGQPVYLPIDSKFPGDRYAQLQEAQAQGDRELVAKAEKELEKVLRSEAKDIRDKYLKEPYTTNFGIMFLPFEGLYAEAVNMGMVERLQTEYHVNIAGPSTMAALLNALQMGFQTLAIQKRSSEVWQVLSEVKTEFAKFEEILTKMQGHLNQTSKDLDALLTTRTRAINRKLKDVQTALPAGEDSDQT
ncbi:MAG: DNA recombination protein RmuC [Oscillospiraceae bacterium]|nr:DNA recombination protein RmuC [Oscillospiraceae bacterium]